MARGTPVYGHALPKFRETCNSQFHARFGLTLRGSRFLVTVGLGLGEHQGVAKKKDILSKGGISNLQGCNFGLHASDVNRGTVPDRLSKNPPQL